MQGNSLCKIMCRFQCPIFVLYSDTCKIQKGGLKVNGNYFLLPNTIFDEGLTPMEFMVYSFFISKKDKNNQSYYSIPHIAKHCGICENSCRKAIKNLADKGLVYVMERYMGNAQQSNIYTVYKI